MRLNLGHWAFVTQTLINFIRSSRIFSDFYISVFKHGDSHLALGVRKLTVKASEWKWILKCTEHRWKEGTLKMDSYSLPACH